MSRPVVSDFTERVYATLPEAYRDDDAALDDGLPDGSSNGFPLLRFLSLVGDQGGAVSHLLDRIDPDVDAGTGLGSELLDPQRADLAWLPWLAQLLGVQPRPGEALTRDSFVRLARQSGSREALRLAVANALTTGSAGGPFGGTPQVVVEVSPDDPWLLVVSTYAVQTPDVTRLPVVAESERPAGVELTFVVRPGLTWGQLASLGITWNAAQASALTWNQLSRMVPRT